MLQVFEARIVDITLELIKIYKQQIVVMVDRYKSLLGNSKYSQDQMIAQSVSHRQYQQAIRSANIKAERMRRIVIQYQKTVRESDQNQKIQQFKQEQVLLRKDRQYLYRELKKMEMGRREQQVSVDPKYMFLKKQLIKATQHEMNLEMQLNQKVNNKKQKIQDLSKNLQHNSPKLQNALKDILDKREQIIYLQQSIKQCLQLFQQIQILTAQTTEKLQITLQNLKDANIMIDNAVKNIDKAARADQKCRNKTCCVIVLLVIILALAAVIYFGITWF